MNSTPALLRLLQLVSPSLPVGAYSYSEGLETLVQAGTIANANALADWLKQELCYGAIRLEAKILLRVYEAAQTQNFDQLNAWNQWISALRETSELRDQSWQMGRSLIRLLGDLEPELAPMIAACHQPCHFTTAFALAAWFWQIEPDTTLLGYFHSWASNLVNAGIRLIPLGQTQGQKLLLTLYPQLEQAASEVLALGDDEMWSCSWGLTLASMNHETLYSRLFRS